MKTSNSVIQKAFDEIEWAHQCADLAARARGRSGTVWELYVRHLSADVDEALQHVPAPATKRAIEIARDFGYAGNENEAAYFVWEASDMEAVGLSDEELTAIEGINARIDAHRQKSGKGQLKCIVLERSQV
ncbi:hypothetical protein AVME950_00025 [Acidovorax sp. SUPP950]|uniref:hypothetical protein n=1 Tax=Acidovorax sp. SUPP950 TaxID=511901 RepID=UPI0023CAB0DE|nr:hypothetical protein [Acidovorax sp. SUPP950]GKS73223.1 hypothetical protein AVME950_00025 [Acidovorax sp. SUPP950]